MGIEALQKAIQGYPALFKRLREESADFGSGAMREYSNH
jgi:hypothetical protein